MLVNVGALFRLLDHGQQDLQLLGLELPDLLGILVERRRLHLLRQLAQVGGQLQALDVPPGDRRCDAFWLSLSA